MSLGGEIKVVDGVPVEPNWDITPLPGPIYDSAGGKGGVVPQPTPHPTPDAIIGDVTGNISTGTVKLIDGIPAAPNGDVAPLPGPIYDSVGGKGGVVPNVYYAGAAPAQVGNFDNSGRIVDPTLLAQQAMLNRAPVSYQPIISPDNYQNFYQAPSVGGNVGGNLVVPDYRPQATVFRQDFANQQAAASGGDSGSSGSTASTSNPVGGSGASGLVNADGTFGGGLGQGVGSQNAQDVAFSVLGATQGPLGYTVPGAIANAAAGAYLDNQIDAISNAQSNLDSVAGMSGIATVSDANGNTASFSTPGTVALSDANTFGGIGTNMGIGDTGSTAPGGGGVADTGTVSVGGVSVSNDASIAAQDAANFGPSVSDGGGGGGGGGKIICTAMNHAYGFGSFRNAIWIAYADKHLTKAHEVGYHTLFLPLVDFGFKRGNGRMNMAVRKVLEWGTRHRSTDLRAEMRGTKRDTTGRIIRFIFEPLCYAVGKLKGY